MLRVPGVRDVGVDMGDQSHRGSVPRAAEGLPEGVVTFVFTDIEGSTKLLQQVGDSYADLLGTHRRLLRSSFAAYGGSEVDTQGDAFFYAFPSPHAAIEATADAQRQLHRASVAGERHHQGPDGTACRGAVARRRSLRRTRRAPGRPHRRRWARRPDLGLGAAVRPGRRRGPDRPLVHRPRRASPEGPARTRTPLAARLSTESPAGSHPSGRSNHRRTCRTGCETS